MLSLNLAFSKPSLDRTQPAREKEQREWTTTPRKPRGTAPTPIGCSGPAPAPPLPRGPGGGESRASVLPNRLPCGILHHRQASMAAQPVSRVVRRVLRAGVRSCSSGAPVTQPCPGEPVVEVSPSASTLFLGEAEVRPLAAQKHPGLSAAAASESGVRSWEGPPSALN